MALVVNSMGVFVSKIKKEKKRRLQLFDFKHLLKVRLILNPPFFPLIFFLVGEVVDQSFVAQSFVCCSLLYTFFLRCPTFKFHNLLQSFLFFLLFLSFNSLSLFFSDMVWNNLQGLLCRKTQPNILFLLSFLSFFLSFFLYFILFSLSTKNPTSAPKVSPWLRRKSSEDYFKNV